MELLAIHFNANVTFLLRVLEIYALGDVVPFRGNDPL